MPLSFFYVLDLFEYINMTTYIGERVYMELIFKYCCYLIKVYLLGPKCIGWGLDFTLLGFH